MMDGHKHSLMLGALLRECLRTACLALMASAMIVQPVEHSRHIPRIHGFAPTFSRVLGLVNDAGKG